VVQTFLRPLRQHVLWAQVGLTRDETKRVLRPLPPQSAADTAAAAAAAAGVHGFAGIGAVVGAVVGLLHTPMLQPIHAIAAMMRILGRRSWSIRGPWWHREWQGWDSDALARVLCGCRFPM